MPNTQIFPPYGISSVTITNNPLNVQDVSDGIPGTVAPTDAIQIGGTDGTNLRAVSTDVYGNLNVNVSPSSNLNQLYVLLLEQTQLMLLELRALKTAIIALDKTLLPEDFEASSYQDQVTSEVSVA